MDIRWSRWKVWIFFLVVVVGTAIVMVPWAEGAGVDRYACGHSSGSDLSHPAGEIPAGTRSSDPARSTRQSDTIRSIR